MRNCNLIVGIKGLKYSFNALHTFVLVSDDGTEDERDEADEKNRLISQVLELQNTLDGERYPQYGPRALQHLHARKMRAIWRIYTHVTRV